MGQYEEESHVLACVVNWAPSWEYSLFITELPCEVALAGNVFY